VYVANVGVDCAEVRHALIGEPVEQKKRFDGIFVGRFHAQKGLTDLIGAWTRVLRSIPDARLAIVGDGSSGAALEFRRQLKVFPNNSIEFFGAVTGPRKYALMSSANVLLFPSHHESWGLVALEAMAVGLPVVGYDLPSSREAFGDAMFRVPTFDSEAFADAVVRLLKDDGLRDTYRRRGLEVATEHDWAEIAGRLAKAVIG
jgi:phosphatidylinositol alpha-mannosyltransferase